MPTPQKLNFLNFAYASYQNPTFPTPLPPDKVTDPAGPDIRWRQALTAEGAHPKFARWRTYGAPSWVVSRGTAYFTVN